MEVLDLSTYQSSCRRRQCILNQCTRHLYLERLLLRWAFAGFQRPDLRPYQPAQRPHYISRIHLLLHFMAVIHQHNQRRIRRLTTELLHLHQVWREELEEHFHQARVSEASSQFFRTEIRATFSARNSASSTSLKVAQNRGKSLGVKSDSRPLGLIVE